MKWCVLLTAVAIGAAAFLPSQASAHGCHRDAKDSKDGWHEHVGPNCRWVPSSPEYRNRRERCETKCKYIGPIKKCKRVCHWDRPRRWRD